MDRTAFERMCREIAGVLSRHRQGLDEPRVMVRSFDGRLVGWIDQNDHPEKLEVVIELGKSP